MSKQSKALTDRVYRVWDKVNEEWVNRGKLYTGAGAARNGAHQVLDVAQRAVSRYQYHLKQGYPATKPTEAQAMMASLGLMAFELHPYRLEPEAPIPGEVKA